MTPPESQPLRAAIWMIGAVVSFSAMAIAAREISFELDTFEIMMYRSFIGIVIVLTVAFFTGSLNQINTRSMRFHLIRNVSHFAGQNLWLFAITIAPLAQVFALEFTLPIWAMFMAIFVLNERLTANRVITAFVGFIGILIVTRPWAEGINLGVITAALAAIGFAGSAVFTRLLTRTVSITCIMFWLTTMQAIFGIICAGYDGAIALPSQAITPWLILIGSSGLVAHFCLTKALSLAPASVVTPVDFARLPIIAILAMLLYGEPLQMQVFVGAIIIFAANYFNILVETRAARAKTAA
ncbi:MAG: DMT family transporter [Paracoccaceae bacterium]